MDYELMMNGNIKIGEAAPKFQAASTQGNVSLEDYKGKWLVFFSHPGDFTPVCTTEMVAFSRANSYFEKANCKLLGLSIDSNSSHLAWVYDIYLKTGITIPFPIVADRNGEIARKYGMISNAVSNTETVRNVYIIDDKQIVRSILIYPQTVGRNISEILRIVRALQAVDANNLMAPANWMPCEKMIMKMPQTFKELEERSKEVEKYKSGMNWYLAFKNPNNCEDFSIGTNNNELISDYAQNTNQEENRNYAGRINNVVNRPENDKVKNNTNMRNQQTLQWKNFR